MHRKIKSWLDKFKPGVKFKYRWGDEIYTVNEDKPERTTLQFAGKNLLAFYVHAGKGKASKQYIWVDSSCCIKFENVIEFIENDNA